MGGRRPTRIDIRIRIRIRIRIGIGNRQSAIGNRQSAIGQLSKRRIDRVKNGCQGVRASISGSLRTIAVSGGFDNFRVNTAASPNPNRRS